METKKLITFLVLAIIISSIIIVFKITEDIRGDKKQKEVVGNDNIGNNEQEIPQLKPGDSENTDGESGTAGGGSSGGGSGAGGSSGTESIENKTLPSDINSKPCSFYFSEYSVCAGTCPSGSCVQEGRSCYCKEVWIKL